MTLSVLIPVRNGGSDLRQCLERILAQQLDDDVEVVVVDSGSTDGSVALARELGATVHEIPPERFDHGATRNLAAGLARGDVLVFTSQDAYAEREDWLQRLTAPLAAGPDLAGVYGRQLPHHHASPPERYFLDFLYGPASRTQRLAPGAGGGISMETTLFSNVNAAIPRASWERFPFAEDLIMSEDQEWSRRVLLAGHSLRYEAEAAVRHSHDYSLGAAFRRFFDSGVSGSRSYLGGAGADGVLRRRAVDYARGELRWLVRTEQARWIPYAILYEGTKFVALMLGANHEKLPARLLPRLSGLGNYWTRAGTRRLP
ncbi:MAG: glycosyltransferase family 2 protein [Actinomycetota bacterium]|nr:glycosyltransferase family 2 protein [Actinomycetota bacterium]